MLRSKYNNKLPHILCILLCGLSSTLSQAESIRWVTESWQNYTNKDGTGLYNDIIKAVFKEHQLQVDHVSWKRSLLEVKNGSADMTGATSVTQGYLSPNNAILAPPISILLIKDRLDFQDMGSLQNYVAVWASPYEEEIIPKHYKSLIKGFSVLERKTAYKMLLSGRADYFVDTKALHQAWLDNYQTEPNELAERKEFELHDISSLKLYMIFTNNQRGQKLKILFDQGMRDLAKNGELSKIYAKYHFLAQMPQIN
ncbi:substrate-binding periplasmic protein [Paraglaciecola aestuariivivens]